MRDAPDILTAIGNVEAYSTVSIRSQVAGPVLTAHFSEGQEVAKGQLLFSIDPAPFEMALRKAEANLLRDQALARNAEAEVRRGTRSWCRRITSPGSSTTRPAPTPRRFRPRSRPTKPPWPTPG